MQDLLINWIIEQGIDKNSASLIARAIALIGIGLLAVVVNFVAKKLILRGVRHLIKISRSKWGNFLVKHQVLARLSHFAPAIVIYLLAPIPLKDYPSAVTIVVNLMLIYMIVLSLLLFNAFLDAMIDIYRTFERSRTLPIKGFVQVIKLIVFFLSMVFIISLVLGKSPLYLISGLGALTAVLILVFKDTILGLVAGIQLTANQMIARGDWIEMPKYGADGDITDVTLTTVKVQNWDKTITTIPTWALISDSFKNWRGMSESEGRRIKRALTIDIHTIKLCNDEMLERFSKIQLIKNYLQSKQHEHKQYREQQSIDKSHWINVRQLTNIGTFRAYILAYLQAHPMINHDMTLLVRQLKPTDHGLPIEIYAFCKDKAWSNYEDIQADIFDHLLAIVEEFDLSIFQVPTGNDFKEIIGQSS